MIYAVVPAAGIGSRFGGDTPKQYCFLQDRTVLEHTLQRLLQVESIAKVMVALSPHDRVFASLPVAQQSRIHTCVGGRERMDSVLAALEALGEAKPEDWVLVHDVARPLVRAEDIHALIELALTHPEDGAILANPVRDTMKRSDLEGHILETVDRVDLWHALTPQMFPLLALRDALLATQAADQLVTDEASAMELAGYRPKLLSSARDNLKITYADDLALANLLLGLQQQSGVAP